MTSILKVDTLQKANGATPTAADLGINVAGTIITSKTFRIPSSAADLSVSANADVQWWNETFTTKRANSKILITYHSGQIQAPSPPASGEVNARLAWSLNSSSLRANIELDRDHNHEWYRAISSNTDLRFFISGQALTNSVSAGTHTIYAHVGAYNSALTFGHQGAQGDGLRGAIITFQEIAG